MRYLIVLLVCISSLAIPQIVYASPVISEVMWMGSDKSTADEWLEITNPDADDADISGWSITSLNSSAKEVVIMRFATGTIIGSGEYQVIAARSAANSRLLAEPFTVSSSMSLLNTKLLLRLRDAENTVIDTVDDGTGEPFAGANPSGGGPKASMERVDLAVSGSVKENWVTSSQFLGFDEGSPIFGSPGFSYSADTPDDAGSCTDPLNIAIAIQSGLLVGVGKTTVNFQAIATAGTLTGVSCSWSYGDGFTSASCNPPSHSFLQVGTFIVRLEAKNQCGITLIQEQVVEVLADPSSRSKNAGNSTWYDGSRLVFLGALPNPIGADTGKEWIEIKNLEDRAVDVRGWTLAVGETSVQSYPLSGSIGPRGIIRIYDSELKFKLPNTTSRLRLMTPTGVALSSIPWKSGEEDRVYLPDDIRSVAVRGRVVQVTGPVTFILQLEPDASAIIGNDTVNVKILGVNHNPETEIQENSNAYETLRAIIENKNIELQFDTETWDDLGRLVAHVYIEGGILAETQMIISKLWVADTSAYYLKKKDFLELQHSLPESASADYSNDITDFSALDIALSEIYPSPFPASKAATEDDWKSKEWLEIKNFAQRAVDLSGWALKTGRSEKQLPEGLKVMSGSMLVIFVSSIGLNLRNAGDTVSLIAPDGTVVASLEYPDLKNGMAFALHDSVLCHTIQPTPGQPNVCVSPLKKATKRKAVAKKVSAPKKTSARVKSYAASYRAQVNSDAPVSPLILSEQTLEDSHWGWVVFAFVLGGVSAGCGVLVARRWGWGVVISRS